MPIHDQGYRRYQGRRQAHGHTWWVIARAGLMERLRERKFLGLLLLSCGQSTIRFMPPLMISKVHVDEPVTILAASMEEAMGR